MTPEKIAADKALCEALTPAHCRTIDDIMLAARTLAIASHNLETGWPAYIAEVERLRAELNQATSYIGALTFAAHGIDPGPTGNEAIDETIKRIVAAATLSQHMQRAD